MYLLQEYFPQRANAMNSQHVGNSFCKNNILSTSKSFEQMFLDRLLTHVCDESDICLEIWSTAKPMTLLQDHVAPRKLS